MPYLEKVPDGHGAMGETVHKLGLQHTFHIVEGPTGKSNAKKQTFEPCNEQNE